MKESEEPIYQKQLKSESQLLELEIEQGDLLLKERSHILQPPLDLSHISPEERQEMVPMHQISQHLEREVFIQSTAHHFSQFIHPFYVANVRSVYYQTFKHIRDCSALVTSTSRYVLVYVDQTRDDVFIRHSWLVVLVESDQIV